MPATSALCVSSLCFGREGHQLTEILQSAIVRMKNGGTRPTWATSERVTGAVGQDLAVVVGTRLIVNRSIAKMIRSGYAAVRKAS